MDALTVTRIRYIYFSYELMESIREEKRTGSVFVFAATKTISGRICLQCLLIAVVFSTRELLQRRELS